MQINWRKPIIQTLLSLSGSKVLNNLEYIRQLDSKSEEVILAEQEIKLKELLLHAYHHVPYYRVLLPKVGVIDSTGGVDLTNFSQIPLLTKDLIRKLGHHLFSDDHNSRKSYINTSGGSTGEPVKFLQDKKYWDLNGIAIKLYFHETLGKEMGEPEINLWGSERDIYHNSLGFKERIINYLYNRTFLNAFRVSKKDLLKFVDIINKTRPVSMWVYVESIDLLARFIKEQKLKVHAPKFIITTAGTLYPEIRKTVEEVFKCPVYNQYGSREVGAMAIECERQDGLHVFPYLQYLENINGEVVVTSLTNLSMPLIRYKIGDTAEFNETSKCECGRSTKVLKSITGRTISHFKTSAGEIVHGQYFIHQFYFLDWVKQFKVVQTEINHILCLIVKREKENQQDLKNIESNIKLVMGDLCDVQFKYVDTIEPTESGKYLYTESKIS